MSSLWLRTAVAALGVMLTSGMGGTTVGAAGGPLVAPIAPTAPAPPRQAAAGLPDGAVEAKAGPAPRLTWSLKLQRVELGLSHYDTSDAAYTLTGSAKLANRATGPLTYSATHLTEYSNDVPTNPPGVSSGDPCGSGPPHPFGYCNLTTHLLGTRPGTLRQQQVFLSRSGTVRGVELAIARRPTELVDVSCTGDCGSFPKTGEESLADETLRQVYDPRATGHFTISGFHLADGALTATQKRTVTLSPFRYTVDATWQVCAAGTSQCQLRADPGGPYRIVRGGRVVLDGSKSTPTPGEKITSYQWELKPTEKCGDTTPELARTSFQGRKIGPFVMLCGLAVRLTITDSAGNTTYQDTMVTVSPRSWRVRPVRNLDSSASSSLVTGDTLGLNVGHCTAEALDPGPNPFCPVNPDDGFVVATLKDKGGRFDGVSYVESTSFSISRLSLYNRRYEPGGDIYQHNLASRRYAAAMRQLNRSVHTHEHSHGEALVKESRTKEGNVDQLLESLVGSYHGVIDQAERRAAKAAKVVWNYAEDGSGHLAGGWSGTLEFPDGPGGAWVPESCHTDAHDVLQCSGTIILTPGSDGTIRVREFTPGEEVSGQLHSRPFNLGTTTADGHGTARFVVRLPATFPPGRHQAVLTGHSSRHVVRLSVEVARGVPASPPTLSEGAGGPAVRWAQYLLVRRTLSDDQIDGLFGPVTRQAVEEFQRSRRLAVDGIVGPKTWAALGGGDPEPPTLLDGSTGAVVRRLQRA